MARRNLLYFISAMVVASAAVTGCSQSPQDRYDAAVSALNDSRSDLNEAQNRLQNKRQQVQQAQQAYQQAQQQLESVRNEMQKANEKVADSANDEVLFRVLQRDVLKKSEFSDAAISVGVEQRVVTLTGSVPDKKTRKKADQLVSDQPGVAHVVDRLQIKDGNNAAPSADQSSNDASQQQN